MLLSTRVFTTSDLIQQHPTEVRFFPFLFAIYSLLYEQNKYSDDGKAGDQNPLLEIARKQDLVGRRRATAVCL